MLTEFFKNLARIAIFKEFSLFIATFGLGVCSHSCLFAVFVGVVPVAAGVAHHKYAIFIGDSVVEVFVPDLSDLQHGTIGLH